MSGLTVRAPAFAIPLAMTGCLLAACSSGGASVDDDVTAVDAGAYGVMVESTIRLPQDRTLLAGHYRMGGKASAVSFYRNDLPDDDVAQSAPMPLPAGTPVMVSAHLLPGCHAERAGSAVLVLRSRDARGSTVTDRLAITSDRIRQAVRHWCAGGVRATLRSFRLTPQQVATFRLVVTNPGPGKVDVASRRWVHAGAVWRPAAVTVAEGDTALLVVTARHLRCHWPAGKGPWNSSRLIATGASSGSHPVRLDEPLHGCP